MLTQYIVMTTATETGMKVITMYFSINSLASHETFDGVNTQGHDIILLTARKLNLIPIYSCSNFI